MASAHDVVAYIIEQRERVTTLYVQKLLYYCQAWSLVWDDAPLFSESIRAWDNGPVVGEVFHAYRGQRVVSDLAAGDASRLTAAQRATIDAVLAFYGDKSAEWLSELTHRERPWIDARAGAASERTQSPLITHDALRAYFGTIATGPGKHLPAALMRGLELLVDLLPDEVDLLTEPVEDQQAKLEAWTRGEDVDDGSRSPRRPGCFAPTAHS